MKETTPAAMPPCFDRWCQKFDDLLRTKAQKSGCDRAVGFLRLASAPSKRVQTLSSRIIGGK